MTKRCGDPGCDICAENRRHKFRPEREGIVDESTPILAAECFDCGLEYGSRGWCDVVVPNDIWKSISPSGDEGGLLCFNCIARRLEGMGMFDVELKVTSGPFRRTAE